MSKQEFLALIEKKRAELIEIAMISGLNSSTALHYSRELDNLLNEYNRIFLQKVSSY